MTISGMVAGPATGVYDCGGYFLQLAKTPGITMPQRLGLYGAVAISPALGIFLGTLKGGFADSAWFFDGNVNFSYPFEPCTSRELFDWGEDKERAMEEAWQ